MSSIRSAPAFLLLVIVAAALLAAGCGGDDAGSDDSGYGSRGNDTSAETDGGGGEGGDSEAKATFTSTCGGCHTLSDAGTGGSVGPNLDELAPDVDQVRSAIAEGPGTMPENLLEGDEADAVAEYVADVAGQ